MSGAGCRIARVRLKRGGAEIALLPARPDQNACVRYVKRWSNSVCSDQHPLAAVAMVALWIDPDGAVLYDVSAWSVRPELPLATMPETARAYLQREIMVWQATGEVMKKLGYVHDDDPDAA